MKTGILEQNQNYVNRWVVSYADFVTMLLALFMVLYALSQLDLKHTKTFTDSIDNAFILNTKHENNTGTILNKKTRLIKLFKTTKSVIYLDNQVNSTCNEPFEELNKQFSGYKSQIEKDSLNFENIKNNIKSEFTGKINIIREPRGLLIRLNDTVLSDKGSDIIKDKSLNVLDKIAVALKNEPNSIRIEGHTDNIPVRTGKFPSNWELSTARATNIIKFLAVKHQLDPSRLSAAGYGEYMPVSDNKTSQGRAENRRVDIVVLSSSSKIFEPGNIKNTINNQNHGE